MDDQDTVHSVPQPCDLDIPLFRHQLVSIYNMERLERKQMVKHECCVGDPLSASVCVQTRLGVNADPTGFGKTLSMIGLILRDKMEWDLDLPFVSEKITVTSAGLVRGTLTSRFEKLPCSLILVSPSIVTQWEEEFAHTNLLVDTVTTRKDVDRIEAEEQDVVIVTTSMYNNLVKSYSRYAWKRFIFDEPGHTRVPGMKEVRAGFNWFVTATPNDITAQHRNCRGSFMKDIIGDSWFDFDVDFRGMIIRNDPGLVRASFAMPITEHLHHLCFQPILIAVRGMVSPAISTMVEAGNIEGAIAALGGSRTTNLVDLVRRRKLEELEKIEHRIRIYVIREDQEQVQVWKERELRVREQIDELSSRFAATLQEACPICKCDMENPVLEPKCHNLFCGKCLLTWLGRKETCPICRAVVSPPELIYVAGEDSDDCKTRKAQSSKVVTKIEKVAELVTNNKTGKFLIFSAFDATFEPICRILEESKVNYTLMKGSAKTRQKNISSFKAGNVQVIFLNSSFNGAGINLQETTDLILYHEMAQSTKNQIIGRAERIGRTEPLRVHHLQVRA